MNSRQDRARARKYFKERERPLDKYFGPYELHDELMKMRDEDERYD